MTTTLSICKPIVLQLALISNKLSEMTFTSVLQVK